MWPKSVLALAVVSGGSGPLWLKYWWRKSWVLWMTRIFQLSPGELALFHWLLWGNWTRRILGTQGPILLLPAWLACHFPVLPTSPFPPYSFYPLLANKDVTLPLFEITTHYQLHCIQNFAIMGCLIVRFYYFFVSNLYLGSGSLETASEIGILVHVICWERALRGSKEAEWITRWLNWNMISDWA